MADRAECGRAAPRWSNRRTFVLLGCLAVAVAIVGCGNQREKSRSTGDVGDRDAEDGESAASRKVARNGTKAERKGAKDRGDRNGDVPLDAWPEVWLKDPLAVYSEAGTVGGKDQTNSASDGDAQSGDAGSAKPAATESDGGGAAPSTAGTADWPALIKGDDLADEIKAARSSLSDKLQSVGKFNGNWKEVRIDSSVLAALAQIAASHPDGPSWKANAPLVRDAAAELAAASGSLGDKYYKPSRAAFDKLDALLAGGRAPAGSDAAETMPFSEVAPRRQLMLRMDRGYTWMKSNVNNEATFKKEEAKVSHESALIVTLARVISSNDYEFAEEDEYRNFTTELGAGASQVVESVQNKDFKAYTAALDRTFKACTDCHLQYKNN